MTDALSSFGTIVHIDLAGGGLVPIAMLRDITGPSLSLGTEEVTPQDATGAWRQFVPTLLDGGEVTFQLDFIPTENTHDAVEGLVKDMTDRTLRDFKIAFPEGTDWSFAAYVTGFTPGTPVEGALTADVTLRTSGAMTLE